MIRAVFLDRDGVINEKAPEGQYVTQWGDFHFLPSVARAIALLHRAGFTIVVVSNQRCVAKGLITVPGLESLHQQMCEELARAGATVDEVYYCPHEEGSSCGCRKPAPGMLTAAARDHQIDLAASWMIGDSDADMEAGVNAGCKTARILRKSEAPKFPADLVASSLLDAADQILLLEKSLTPARPHGVAV